MNSLQTQAGEKAPDKPGFLTREQQFFLIALALQQLVWFSGEAAKSPFNIVALASFFLACLFLIFRGHAVPLEQIFSPRNFRIIFCLCSLAAFLLVIVLYYSIHYATYDTGVFANLSYHFLKSGEYYSTPLGLQGFSDHFTPVLMLISPIFLMAKTFLWLPLLKALSFLICPLLLVEFSALILGRQNPLRFFVPLLWFENPLLSKVFEMEFQPSTLALPLVIYAFLLAQRESWVRVWITLLVVSCFKENMALAWLSLGLFAGLYKGNWRQGSALCAFGIFLGLAIYFLLMPALSTGSVSPHAVRFGPFSLVGLKFKLLFTALLSVAFIPLISWRSLIFVVPAFGLALVSNSEIMLGFGHHYQDLPLTCLMISTVLGLHGLSSLRLNTVTAQRIFAAVLFVLILQNNRPLTRRIRADFPTARQIRLVAEVNKLGSAMTDKDVEVWTLDSLGSYFFAAPNLKPIIDLNGSLTSGKERVVIVADDISYWPLDEKGYRQLRSKLDEDALTHKATIVPGWQELRVYAYPGIAVTHKDYDLPTKK